MPQDVALTEELEQAALLQRTIKAQVCIYASLSTSLYPLRTIALDSSHKHLTTHSISWHRPLLSSIVALLEHASMRAARYLLVLMIALEAPQFSRGRLVGPGCCRTTGGGLRAWDEPSTAEAIAAKRVHDFPMNHTACAAHCAALKGCTHFELNMYDQPVHSNEGVCSVFASGGFSVTTGCKDGSDRPRMHCFTAWTNRTRRAGLEIPACECRSTRCLSRHCCSDPNAFASGHRVIDGTECGREHALPSVGEMASSHGCPSSLAWLVPSRRRLPTLFLLGPGHTGSSELWRQVNLHPLVVHPAVPSGQPSWTAKEPNVWRLNWNHGHGLRDILATDHGADTVLVDGTPMAGSIEAPLRLQAAYACEAEAPLPHFVMMLRDPLEIVASALKHALTSPGFHATCHHSSRPTCALLNLANGNGLADALLSCITRYNACASESRRVGLDASLVWPTCAIRIQSACGEAPASDCVLCRAVSNAFVTDMRAWWLRFVPATHLHLVHNRQLTGGAAARAVWEAVGLADASHMKMMKAALGATRRSNAHEAANYPAALQNLLLHRELQEAFASENSSQSLLLSRPQKMVTSVGVTSSRKFVIGVVANEFFDLDLGRMGGFGWSTRLLADVFRRRKDLNVQLIFIFADQRQRKANSRRHHDSESIAGMSSVHGWPLIELHEPRKRENSESKIPWTQRYLQAAQPDVFIFIDFRDSYLRAHTAMPHVPIILWARDPRTKQQAELIQVNS